MSKHIQQKQETTPVSTNPTLRDHHELEDETLLDAFEKAGPAEILEVWRTIPLQKRKQILACKAHAEKVYKNHNLFPLLTAGDIDAIVRTITPTDHPLESQRQPHSKGPSPQRQWLAGQGGKKVIIRTYPHWLSHQQILTEFQDEENPYEDPQAVWLGIPQHTKLEILGNQEEAVLGMLYNLREKLGLNKCMLEVILTSSTLLAIQHYGTEIPLEIRQGLIRKNLGTYIQIQGTLLPGSKELQYAVETNPTSTIFHAYDRLSEEQRKQVIRKKPRVAHLRLFAAERSTEELVYITNALKTSAGYKQLKEKTKTELIRRLFEARDQLKPRQREIVVELITNKI